MKRIVCTGLLASLLLIQTGCIAVSAKEINRGMRYEAVAAADGKVYVVDKKDRTARAVRILTDAELADP